MAQNYSKARCAEIARFADCERILGESMKHLGDITKIKGYEAPMVDVIVGGSPCQDLSVAGKRAGLNGARSGLFMEQIRIIKEMRDESFKQLSMQGTVEPCRVVPRYMVWENVQGAFSSNNGEDFRIVLEETAKVADENATIPRLEGGHKWTSSGCILGDGWSIAWRVHDAQFWGVPQRRKRIALVADFGGTSASEILFERKGLPRNTKESEGKRENASNTVVYGTDSAISFQERYGKPGGGKGILIQYDHVGTLGTSNNQAVVYGICSQNSNSMKSSNPNSGIYEADTARTLDVSCLNPSCNQGGMAVVYDASRRHNYEPFGDKCETVQAHYGTGGGNVLMVLQPYTSSKSSFHTRFTNDGIVETLVASDYKDPPTVYESNHVVRRLTPLECERLQGFPDHWTDIGDWTDSKGKKHKGESDAPRYKALGNSIALPFWNWLAGRIGDQLKKDGFKNLTMASLFDGIGGFPLVFGNNGFKPVWASEIEEFPMAVTKLRFKDD